MWWTPAATSAAGEPNRRFRSPSLHGREWQGSCCRSSFRSTWWSNGSFEDVEINHVFYVKQFVTWRPRTSRTSTTSSWRRSVAGATTSRTRTARKTALRARRKPSPSQFWLGSLRARRQRRANLRTRRPQQKGRSWRRRTRQPTRSMASRWWSDHVLCACARCHHRSTSATLRRIQIGCSFDAWRSRGHSAASSSGAWCNHCRMWQAGNIDNNPENQRRPTSRSWPRLSRTPVLTWRLMERGATDLSGRPHVAAATNSWPSSQTRRQRAAARLWRRSSQSSRSTWSGKTESDRDETLSWEAG